MTPASTALLAHGLGGSTDLPIPYTYALIGAAWTLTFTFAVVALAWRQPRFDPDKPGRPLPSWVTTTLDSAVTRWGIGLLSLALTGWVAYTALTRPAAVNPLPTVFYVLLWVGLVAASVLLGPVWRLISPVRAVCRFLPAAARSYPERIGYWPAAVGLFAFVWLELASPDPGSVAAIRNWLLIYLVLTLTGAVFCGPRWLESADPFEVYSTVASKLSPLRRHDGRMVLGNPFDHLPSLPVRPGLVAVLAVLLGSTAFDSFSAMPQWRNFVDAHSGSPLGASLIRTAGLLVFATTVAVTFWAATRATGGVDRRLRRELPGLMAHSLVPIVVGYVFAHYLSYLVERGQQAVILLFGLHDVQVSYFLSAHPTLLATLKVGFVLAGHVAGVIAAHDRALRLLPKRHQLTGQLATMLVMVGYTFTGLYLLFGG
ncbi:hypothetical protein A5731_02985 [Mycolicibacterium conceptionense]|uniref:Fenitrothion hydrolase n=1 Tax=Mycolicibacterium conceptionense TaxID=451644 RepID=A0A1A0PJD3_9MYCO|nr:MULTISPECIES: hypothetical protein [Mycolicibacterium]MCW1823980.1 hypothetical protein [Mycolicibacterium senegalense]OBB10051.1 hypothetical protein A5718_08975 [Mycolicibacterium conceptionense]OBF08997.1 hypothetical protein A5731_02985 [Mycolicibacterium conceptionense]OBF28801.1 hypothetical protein A5726_02460 [Mycolicibacterium conceptionense]OBF39723.1 hypothetical protein A5720_00475 [Mycolicibacterium conceptionense]